MLINLQHNGQSYSADLSRPIPISLIYNTNNTATSAWYVPPVRIEPVQMGDWVGSVAAGNSVNFNNIQFNPHGNGTHTECVGHIAPEVYSIVKHLQSYNFVVQLVTIAPTLLANGDWVVTAAQLANAWNAATPASALVIRTLPNDEHLKRNRAYSNTNPPYLTSEAMEWIVIQNIEHLLLDLPSVDREQDEGKLAAHRIFWQYPTATRWGATITEMIYVPDSVADGLYFLQLQIAPFENDATPSMPVLYNLTAV